MDLLVDPAVNLWESTVAPAGVFSDQGLGLKLAGGLRLQGQYGLNPDGKPHSAMISTDTTALVIYTGERDEVLSTEVLDLAAEPAAP